MQLRFVSTVAGERFLAADDMVLRLPQDDALLYFILEYLKLKTKEHTYLGVIESTPLHMISWPWSYSTVPTCHRHQPQQRCRTRARGRESLLNSKGLRDGALATFKFKVEPFIIQTSPVIVEGAARQSSETIGLSSEKRRKKPRAYVHIYMHVKSPTVRRFSQWRSWCRFNQDILVASAVVPQLTECFADRKRASPKERV